MALEVRSAAYGLRSRAVRYAIAVASVAVAIGLAKLLRPFVDAEPVFFAAVIVTSWVAGMGEGLVALLLSAVALFYTVGAPNAGYLIVFVLSALLVSWLSDQRRRAEASLRQARDALEARVQERTADLRRVNAELSAEIAERERAEASLREKANLLDLTHDAIMVRDAEDRIVYWNRAAEEMYGYSAGEALGKTSHLLLKTVFPVPWEEIRAELLEKGRWEGELLQSRRDGREIVVAARWAAQRDDGKDLHEVLAINTDVTERNQAKEALREMQSELERVTRVLTFGELTASIAHEVNQPLAAVVTNANACLRWLAGETPDLDEAREAARRIVRDANRASDVIARTRALFKKREAQREALDLNQVIKEVAALVREELVRARIALRTELSVLPAVYGDRIQLEQVMLNLILNAVEAMRATDGPRQLIIRTERPESNGVLVTVADTGTGLNPEEMDQLFEAYFTTKPNGMGLGLPISRTLVEAHGGRLWADAKAGPGATFHFELPA